MAAVVRCARALAVLLERPHTRSHRSRKRRRWRPADVAPLPAREPGRVVLNALLAPARRARGCANRGDDRLETRAYAVKRYLYRLAHAQRSGRFACSIEQLVAGVAPAMDWQRQPGESRQRFATRHRASLQRWLEDLQRAGVITVEGERDERGMWWRTIITLHDALTPRPEDLAVARDRLRAFARRRRAARRRRRPPRRCLQAILRRSQRPRAGSRRNLARQRARAVHDARRQCQVEQTIAAARQGRPESMKDLRHPFGAPPASAHAPVSSNGREESETAEPPATPAAVRSAPTFTETEAVDDGTGARTHKRPPRPPASAPAAPKECIERVEIPSDLRSGLNPSVPAALESQVAATQWRVAEVTRQAAIRACEVAHWPSGRTCPLGRLREAWVVHRHGPQGAANWGAAAAGPITPGLAALIGRAVRLYETFADHRPPGWPQSGPAALITLTRRGDGHTLRGTTGWLLYLAKHMRAGALEHDPTRRERMTRRAQRRRTPAPSPLAFRTGDWRTPRVETAETRRQRVRDELLLAGEDPGLWPNAELAIDWRGLVRGELRGPTMYEALDGLRARADRYRDQLDSGYWSIT